jgi:hypothetical protein
VIVAIHSSQDYWNEPFDDLDWDRQGIRSLIEAVCSVTGLVPNEHFDDAVQS